MLAHYGIMPTDIAGIVAGAMMYQLGGQAYHFTTIGKSNTSGNASTIVPTSSSGTPTTPDATMVGYVASEHPTAKGV